MKNTVKRLTALLLCLSIGVSLAACGVNDPYLYFESERSMLRHLMGVWHGNGVYYIIHDEVVWVLYEADFDDIATQAVTNVLKDRPHLCKDLRELYELHPRENVRYFNEAASQCGYVKRERISDVDYVSGEFNCMESRWIIRESGLHCEEEDIVLEKLSDSTAMENEWIQQDINWAIDHYELKLDVFVLNPTEYVAELKSAIPRVGRYRCVNTNDGVSTYTENGRALLQSDAWLLSSSTTLMWYEDSTYDAGYMLTYGTGDEEKCAVTVVTTDRSQNPNDMDEMMEAALMCLGGYPHGLSVKEIKTRFRQEGQLVGDKKKWSATVGEVEYTMEMDDETQTFGIVWEK